MGGRSARTELVIRCCGRCSLVELDERGRLAELVSDIAPQVFVAGDRAARDRHDLGRDRLEPRGDFFRNEYGEIGIGRQIAKSEHRMGFAATHGLLQFEHGLSRDTGQKLHSPTQQRFSYRR